ncbi:MmgE/PrpD family protein [Bosea sp. ASV33]|uniref:MmgE/PrpD family protein n=1 Tax=Bosea sp. ASV33 TaxID=2795106 RepID=UPI0018EDA0EE|nr:MmgE/PrpD family protein [Bosea sp. ASV33]
MQTMIEKLAHFAGACRFDDLPRDVVSESQRILLDSIGVAIGGIGELKGKAGIAYGKLMGGAGDATIMGTGDKTSVFGAAFANSELINTLDMDAVLPPGHVVPYVLPAIMALGETLPRDGREVVRAIAVSHEMSNRIGMGMDYLRDTKDGEVDPPPVFGYAETIFGATAAIGMLRGLQEDVIAHALGIAGSISPVNSQTAWFQHAPSSTIKYQHAGTLVQSAFTASYAAEFGHRGDIRILDDEEFGYRRFIGTRRWFADRMMADLGTEWRFPAQSSIKPYPHCRVLHALIDTMTEILDTNAIEVEEIDGIKIYVEGMVEQPVWLNREILTTHDAQFSIAHGIAVGAHRVPPGPRWMDPDLVFGSSVMGLMEKVTHEVHPDYVKLLSGNAASRPAKLEVRARGQVFSGERRYPKGSRSPDPASFMTDEELIAKFQRNVEGILPRDNAERIIEQAMNLAGVPDFGAIMRLTAPGGRMPLRQSA